MVAPDNQRNTDDMDENVSFVRVVSAIKDELKCKEGFKYWP